MLAASPFAAALSSRRPFVARLPAIQTGLSPRPHTFHPDPTQAGDPKSALKRKRVAALFDRNHCLTGWADRVGQCGLAHTTAFFPGLRDAVCNGRGLWQVLRACRLNRTIREPCSTAPETERDSATTLNMMSPSARTAQRPTAGSTPNRNTGPVQRPARATMSRPRSACATGPELRHDEMCRLIPKPRDGARYPVAHDACSARQSLPAARAKTPPLARPGKEPDRAYQPRSKPRSASLRRSMSRACVNRAGVIRTQAPAATPPRATVKIP